MSCKKYDFSGKAILVTGSSAGIGAEIAKQFAEYGGQVTITGRKADALGEVAKDIHDNTGHEPLQVIGDLGDPSFPETLLNQHIEKYGRLDVLVNNAGLATAHGQYASEKFLEEFDKVMMVNLRSVVTLIKLSIPYLEQTKGNIVNISSIASFRPFDVTYSSSKAAIDMVTIASAQELGAKGIRVNCVNPGVIVTGLGRSLGMDDWYKINEDIFKAQSPLNRMGQPKDIANLVTFLASDDAENITGSLMVSDSGARAAQKAVFSVFDKKLP